MKRYSVQPRCQKFIKSYRFSFFAKNMGKTIGRNISKIWSGKYSQKLFDHAKQSDTDTFKTASKGATQKTAEATGDLIDNKNAKRIAKSFEKFKTK